MTDEPSLFALRFSAAVANAKEIMAMRHEALPDDEQSSPRAIRERQAERDRVARVERDLAAAAREEHD